MRMRPIEAILFAAALAAATASLAEDTWPTPEIAGIDELDIPGTLTYAMRGALGDTGVMIGVGAMCTTTDPHAVQVTAFFGGFPDDRRPVQVAVRTADGNVERFGPVVRGGPESGFHSPRISDPAEATRFAQAAFLPGSLVSNGFRSFWNRAGAVRNREVREAFVACLRQHP